MFFDDSLQSGIALALRESKCVACFMRDTDAQSRLWENDFLQDNEVSQALAAKAVTLRLDAGSQEAGFLSAYYPIPVTPSLVILRGGHLLLDLRAGIEKEQFKKAILGILGDRARSYHQPGVSSSTGNTTVSAGTTDAQPTSNTPVVRLALPGDTVTPVPPATTPSTILIPTSAAAATSRTDSTVQDLLTDRRRRLEVDKREKEAAAKAEQKAKIEARREAVDVGPGSAKARQASYAQQQRKRQQEAKLERERIMRVIESDKQGRREKEQLRKAFSKAEVGGDDDAGGLVDRQLLSEIVGPRPKMSKDCAIQVRLLDGSTIRSKFLPDHTLHTAVRAWVDQQRSDGDTPYIFKQILTPLPNRTIAISEEETSLVSLGVMPSATFVMVPVQGYIAAYAGNPGIISRGLYAGYNMVSAGISMATGALGTVFGLGHDLPQEPPTPAQATTVVPSSRARGTGNEINIRTLRHLREARDDHQLYNGNQLNFEPRRDIDSEVD